MAAEHTSRIGARIAELRTQRGMSQRELADAIPGKTDGNQISKWERGQHRPGDDALDRIASVLGVDASYFLVPEPAAGTADLMKTLSPGATQVDRIEAKLDAIMAHLGISPSGSENPFAEFERELVPEAEQPDRRARGTASG